MMMYISPLTTGDPQWLDMAELKDMASYPTSANVLQVENFNALTMLVGAIRDAICNSELFVVLYLREGPLFCAFFYSNNVRKALQIEE